METTTTKERKKKRISSWHMPKCRWFNAVQCSAFLVVFLYGSCDLMACHMLVETQVFTLLDGHLCFVAGFSLSLFSFFACFLRSFFSCIFFVAEDQDYLTLLTGIIYYVTDFVKTFSPHPTTNSWKFLSQFFHSSFWTNKCHGEYAWNAIFSLW